MSRTINISSHIPIRLALVCAAILLLALVMPMIATACPSCDEVIAQENHQGLSQGLSYSAIGLIGMPFLLFATVAGIVIRAYRKQKRSNLADFDRSQLN